MEFAKELATCADYYVNDAFAALHRDDTSIALLPTLFDQDKRSIGLLVQHELQALTPLKQAKKPFVLIVGGGKVADKLPLLEGFLDSVSAILLCPAFVFTFLKAAGKPVGKSLVYDDALEMIPGFLKAAHERNVKVLFPVDYQIATGSLDGPLSIVDADAIPANGYGISIGPATIQQFAPVIKEANTILYNCAMGFPRRPQTLDGAKKLLQEIGKSSAYSVIAGGDSVALVNRFGLQKKMRYLTTGGGSVLTYLSGRPLPGLAPLCQ